MSDKRVKALIRELTQAGWSHRKTGKGHNKLTNPATGKSVVISESPSDGRWYENAKADIRRAGNDQKQKTAQG